MQVGEKTSLRLAAPFSPRLKRGACGCRSVVTRRLMLLDQITVDHALNVRAAIDEETVVLDPFAGGGVCGEAAIGLERRYVGIELDSHWHQRAQDRVAAASLRWYDPALAEVC